MYRCYACKASFSDTVRESSAAIGLCEHCQRRSTVVKHELAQAQPARFGEEYFHQDDIDEPVCSPQRCCNRCGTVGSIFKWNHWAIDETVNGPNESPRATGDGYAYCQNCATLSVTPWSESSDLLHGAPVGIAPHIQLNTRTTEWVMEAILLLVLALAIVISCL